VNAHKKNLGSHNRYEGEICAEEEKGIPVVKRRKREGMRIYQETIEKRIYLTLKVASDSASVLCRKERWEEVDGTRRNNKKVGGKQLVCETGEVQVESKRGSISRSSNWARRYKDGEEEDKMCIGMANTEMCQRCTEVFRIGELLLSIHSRLCIYS